jgi:esterase/lipase
MHEMPVLLGVSFGGILVQEMAMHIQRARKVIIISSVVKVMKSFPGLKIAKDLRRLIKLIPIGLM